MKKTGAQIIMEVLLEQGVDTIFGYPGATVLAVYDALYAYSGKIRISSQPMNRALRTQPRAMLVQAGKRASALPPLALAPPISSQASPPHLWIPSPVVFITATWTSPSLARQLPGG